MTRPAEDLVGTILSNGWRVVERIKRKPTATGGRFSFSYIVEHPDGRTGFMKAMDYFEAFHATDTAGKIKEITNQYVFEREICLKCSTISITRVVHAIDHGSYTPVGPLGPFAKVEYLIFERADGDIRAIIDQQPALDCVFALHTLHGTAAALEQLHRAQIAHQDVKPSNVVVFVSQNKSKLADLGRAWSKEIVAPHDGCPAAGDLGYAPFELFYGEPLDEQAKRFGYDMYLLGSFVVFMFARCHINSLIIKNLDPTFRANSSSMTYAESLPYLQAAFAEALKDFVSSIPDESLRAKLTTIVTEMCDPDYSKRGNPGSTGVRRFSLIRYVSAFDALRRQAELNMKLGK